MSRVYFDLPVSAADWIGHVFAPAPIRGALKVARKINFQPDIKRSVRAKAVNRLRDRAKAYAAQKQHFPSDEALAVLAFMDTFEKILRKHRRKIRKLETSDPQSADIWRRKAEFYQSKLATCALYMRRAGYMTPEMLGDELYRATTAIETIYVERETPNLQSLQPLQNAHDGCK